MEKVIAIFFILMITLIQAQPLPPAYMDSSQYEVKTFKAQNNCDISSPLSVDSSLYFIANAPTERGIKNFDASGNPLYRIYQDDIRADQQLFKDLLKTSHEGPFSFNKNKDQVWFTTNKKHNQHSLLTIKEAVKTKDGWEQRSIPFFDTLNVSVCHPFVYDDGQKMIFSAEMKNGYGGMDLYSIENINGHWRNLKNLGPLINSDKNEVFPSFNFNGHLVYSSNKAGTDLDFYSFDFKTNTDTKLPYPFNSPSQETGLSYNQQKKCWYISSNRNGNSAIFSVHFSWPYTPSGTTVTAQSYCYDFAEESTIGLNDTNKTSYEWDFGDGTKSRSVTASHCFKNPGTYTVLLNIIDKSTGVTFLNQVNYALVIEDTFIINSKMNLDTLIWSINSKNSEIRKVYIEVDDAPYYCGTGKSTRVPVKWTKIKEYYYIIKGNTADTICKVRLNTTTVAVDSLSAISDQPYTIHKDKKVNTEKTADEKTKVISGKVSNYQLIYSVNYKASGYKLTTSQQEELKQKTDLILKEKKFKIIIVSGSDASGSPKYNKEISRKRSEEVYRYIQSLGFSKKQLKIARKKHKNDQTNNTGRESNIYLKYEN